MANFSKFKLNPELWSKLPRKSLEDAILCSPANQAAKLLRVSKDIKEFIEKNRERMPLAKDQAFFFAFKYFDDIEVNADAPNRVYVDCRKNKSRKAGPFHQGFGRPTKDHLRPGTKFCPTDTTLARMTAFFHKLLRWVRVERVLVRWNTFDPPVLVPLIQSSSATIGFKDKDDRYDDGVMDVIEKLNIRNIELPTGVYFYTHSFLFRLKRIQFERVRLEDVDMLHWCDCSHVVIDSTPTTQINDHVFMYDLVCAFRFGHFKRLTFASFRFNGTGDWSALRKPLKKVAYVPTAAEAAPKWPARTPTDIRVFLDCDTEKERLMEVKVRLVSKPFTLQRDIFVELLITPIGSDAPF